MKAAELKDVAVTVNLDLGEINDLHPLNKREVAYRMSLAVRGLIFGESLIWKGPWLSKWAVSGEWIRLTFETGDTKGLAVHQGTGLEEFEIAGTDGKYYPVSGEVEDKEIAMHCSEVKQPKHLRYCWSNAPQAGLVYNEAGLLAAPFEISLF